MNKVGTRQKKQIKKKGKKTRTTVQTKDLLKELELLIRSHCGLIWIKTEEEERAESLLKLLSDTLKLSLFVWSIDRGLRREINRGVQWDELTKPIEETKDPEQALEYIDRFQVSGIYHFQGLGPFLDNPNYPALGTRLVNVSKKFAQERRPVVRGALVLTGGGLQFSDDTRRHVAVLSFPPPGRMDYAALLRHLYRDLSLHKPIKMEMSHDDMHRLLNNLQGLTLLEAKKILTKAMIEDGKLAPDDIQLVIQAKKSIIEREGLLEYYSTEESLESIADMEGLKDWLAKRKSIITNPREAMEIGLVFPKGILLVGIPGTGKSLCAKAVAMEWRLPLLKMDPSALYNKYMGESERNFKRAMETAEKMSPVILWIDEIEKAFASSADGDFDAGTSQRILGTFLTWMQERKGDVFVVATSNDVSKLPPEFLRKGRFDEIFFIDLPDEQARQVMFEIHLNRRGYDPDQFDTWSLAEAADGFSGAEIEQVIVSALYTAFSENSSLNTDILVKEIHKTAPLSETRAEDIQALRKWAKERTVSAQYVAPPDSSAPTRQDFHDLLTQIYQDLQKRLPVKVEMSDEDINRLINNLQGLTLVEAKKILTKAMIRDARLAPEDIQFVIQAKKDLLGGAGVLEYYEVSERLEDIADLISLKAWLAKRRALIDHPERAEQAGLHFPKGILLLGVPGTGKSLCARAVALEWGLPLLKMDPSSLYDKYVGESEKNFKQALETAGKMAPVVLWIDELEKAFAGSGETDGGTSQRILGMLLSWMQDRKGHVFVVATSNDVAQLPPEFLRKGRFDEIFFVDLPDDDARKTIFEIHLKRRKQDSSLYDLDRLAETTEGFSGAEIEQVIVSALYTAFAGDVPLTTEILLEETHTTCPLSKTRFEHIQALRQWAEGRTVSAQ